MSELQKALDILAKHKPAARVPNDLDLAIALLVRAYGDLDVSNTAIIVGSDAGELLRDIGAFLERVDAL